MRTFLRATLRAVALLVILSTAAATAWAADAGPSADSIMGLIGGRFTPMFAKYGGPNKAVPVRSPVSTQQDDVLLWYDQFEARISSQKTISAIYFNFSDWKTPIHGIKAGAMQPDVRKALGDPDSTDTASGGNQVVDTWNLKDLGCYFKIYYTGSTDNNNNTTYQVYQAVVQAK